MSDHKDSLPKVPQQIGDPISENLQKLAQLFPGIVKDGELDVEALREELGDFAEIQPGDEKYELSWAGKQAAKKKAFEPLLGKTLKYLAEDSKDPETTKNIYLEGDNLEGLKLIRQNYYGAIKMIYIDPPYNTGNDFVYKDNFKSTTVESELAEGARSEAGERLFKNESSSNRYHANWLDMMYPRLKLAKNLLRDDGLIFISIDDGEAENLKKICGEVFGESNFIAQLVWERAFSPKNDARFVSNSHDYVLMFAKNIFDFSIGRLPRTEEANARYQNPDNDPRGPWMSSDISVKTYNAASDFPIVAPSGRIVEPPAGSCWRLSKKSFFERLQDNRIWFGPDGNGVPRIKRFLTELKFEGMAPTSIQFYKEVGHSQEGAQEVSKLLSGGYFSGPKPTRLLRRLLILANTNKESVILDFFSGSATTAHAVMQLNAEDGGKRKHIMVQLPEVCDPKSEAAKAGYATIAEIGKERIRRAGEKIKAELVEKSKTATEEEKEANPYLADPDALDIGFKCFRIEDTKINWLKKDLSGGELVDVDISDKDRLDFVPGFTDLDVVYEIMLRQSSIPLTEPICTLTDIGLRTYLYGESYLICLEEDITKEMVEKLAQLEPTPLKFIFRDSAFGKDIAFKDTTFRRLNAEIAKHTEGEETYTVEFI